MTVTLQEAPARLEELCDAALAGEDAIITRDGVAFIRVEALSESSPVNESHTDSL